MEMLNVLNVQLPHSGVAMRSSRGRITAQTLRFCAEIL